VIVALVLDKTVYNALEKEAKKIDPSVGDSADYFCDTLGFDMTNTDDAVEFVGQYLAYSDEGFQDLMVIDFNYKSDKIDRLLKITGKTRDDLKIAFGSSLN
jgi:hypothetical protein